MTLSTSTIGLFGTCGNSKWRDPFVAEYKKNGIPFFNPLVDNWTPALAEVEAWHLVNDNIILFPVTGETYGVASLGEIGFSILSTLRWNANRFVIVYIEPKVDESVVQPLDKDAVKNSNNARAIIKAHLKENDLSNVFVVDNLEDMLQLSIMLYSASKILEVARSDNWKSQMSPEFWSQIIKAQTTPETYSILKSIKDPV